MQLIHQHGGDLDAIEKKYGIPRSEIKDFSGNINPLGFPRSAEDALRNNLSVISTYPDKSYASLRAAIGQYTGADAENIVVGNGSTELISTFIKTTGAEKSIIVGPAYSEYEREIQLSGGEFEYFPLKEKDNFKLNLSALFDSLKKDIGLLVLCNPNNPTGSAVTAREMVEILSLCKKKNIAVMVDETYIEFADNLKDICSIPLTRNFDNLFVIRGTSKFFAAPGIRLGYGISSNKAFLETLKTQQDPWSVNSLAALAGEYMFKDKKFHADSQRLISDERKKALGVISGWKNIKAYPSSANFILLRLLTDSITAEEIFERLIHKKMLIRDAASFTFLDESYLRFCILSPKDNKALLNELKKLTE